MAPPPADAARPGIGARGLTLAAVVGVGVAAALGQFIPQEESGRKVAASVGDHGQLVLTQISGRQYLTTYLDMVGVVTACDGLTTFQGRKIRKGDHFTEAQCTAELERQLVDTSQHVMACTPGLALSDDASAEHRREGPRFASVSLSHNIGWPTFCRSTARKRFNAGDFPSGCTAIGRFDRAGGRVVKGLSDRRAREMKVCRGGLKALAA